MNDLTWPAWILPSSAKKGWAEFLTTTNGGLLRRSAEFRHSTGEMGRTQGVLYTIKDGIVFDANKMRTRIRELVSERKALESR